MQLHILCLDLRAYSSGKSAEGCPPLRYLLISMKLLVGKSMQGGLRSWM